MSAAPARAGYGDQRGSIMKMRGLTRSVLCLLIWSAGPTIAGQESRPDERVARLIRDLGADSFSARQRASDELARLGAATREQLAAAARSDDLEVRARAEQLLRKLLTDAMWQPALVSLQGDDQPLSAVLAAVTEQSGNRVATGSRYEVYNEHPLQLDVEQASYWQVLDEICRQSGNHFRPHYDVRESGLVLIAGRRGQNPVAYAGPMRVELISCLRLYDDELSYKNMELKRVHSFKLVFQVLWEDRLKLTAYRAMPRVSAALTNDRQQLLQVEAIDTWNVAGATIRQLTLEVKLQPPALDARRLESLLLDWQVMAVGDFAEMTIDDVNSPAPVRQDGVEVVVESYGAKSETLHELVLATTYDQLLPDPPEAVFHENSYQLCDQEGRAWPLVEQSHELRGDLVRSKLTFRREGEAGSSPASLAIRYPRIRSQRELPVLFRDIELPKPLDAAN